ncbi:MAG TPA: hypothetical protein VKX46_03630 [Ktedonobacteraceae bacterium]|nr:hypothetical protein [Ktedonobacteraceae bacterium]
MIDCELTETNQEPEDYRGGLVYRQEYGYTMVTMTVSVAPDEHSYVISYAHHLPLAEEIEHLQGVDLYHFAVTDGTRIQLTIETPADNKEAWYTVRSHEIVAEPSPIELTLVRSEESVPYEYAHTQEALEEALIHYADQMVVLVSLHPCTREYCLYFLVSFC